MTPTFSSSEGAALAAPSWATEEYGKPRIRVRDIHAHALAAETLRARAPLVTPARGGELVVFDRCRRVRTNRSGASRTTRVLIADGRRLLRAGLRALLEARGWIRVVGEARTADEAIGLARRIRPDVVVIDEWLPGLDCGEVTRRMVRELGLGVLLMSASEAGERIPGVLRAGASGVVLKDAEPAELVRAVEVVARGGASLPPGLTRRLIAELVSAPEPASPNPGLLDELSPREREVVALVAHGLDNDEIADRLVISPATAKTHVSRAMIKLGARNRAQVVVLAYRVGLVAPPTAPRVLLGQPVSLAT